MKNYHGWIALNKPKGISSNDAIQKIKKALGKKNKVGHAGTLDPLAEGVLPVAVGEATKTSQYLMDSDKEYEFTICFGQERSTGDAEGEIISTSDLIPSETQIKAIIPKFLGKIKQSPPVYSALKIKGQPAYKLARKGLEVNLIEREINIHSLELIHGSTFRVACSKGTYVRSLGSDIAKALGSVGYISYLKRTKVGKFLLKDTITLDNLIKIVHNEQDKLQLLPVNYGLGDILAIEVSAEQAKSLKNGLAIFLQDHFQNSQIIIQVLSAGILQAIASLEKGLCKPLRVFNI